MEIKALTENEIGDVFLLECECFEMPWSEKSLREALADPLAHFFTAIENGRVVGYVGTHIVADECYITNIAVTADSRQKGVGAMLLRHAQQNAKERGARFISLEVRASNAQAISLYQNNGYETEGRRKAFYDNPREDGLIMTKRFDKGEGC